MVRVLVSVHSLIVLISLVYYPVSSTTTVVNPGINATATPATTHSATSTISFVAIATGVAPRPSVSISNSSGNGTSTSNTSQIVPTPSGNVIVSTSVTAGPPAKKFKARITVDETYKAEYSNTSSTEFQTFARNFSTTVEKFLQGQLSGFQRVKVTKLRNGSVVVDFDIEVETSSNATKDSISKALKAGSGPQLGYTILGEPIVNSTQQPSIPSTQTVTPSKSAPVTKTTTTPPTSTTKGTEIWDKAIDLATPMGTFIIVVVAVALILVLLIALICVCCKYRNLKKRTHFPDHMAITDSEWVRSSDDLLMWERNLRASEVKTTNGISNRPINDKRT